MKHPGCNLEKKRAEVRPIPFPLARNIVEEYHYAESCANTSTFTRGLFYDNELIGCAMWIPPTRSSAESLFGGEWRSVISLSRLVCAPGSPRNAASYLLARSVKFIENDGRYRFLVTYADSWRGHTGQIYRAAGWSYVGRTKPSEVWVDSRGRMRGRKRGPKTLTAHQMAQSGCKRVGRFHKEKFVKTLRRKRGQTMGILS